MARSFDRANRHFGIGARARVAQVLTRWSVPAVPSVAGDLGIPVLTRDADGFADIHDIVRVIALS